LTPRVYKAVFLLASLLLVIAIAPIPYGYYLILRPVVVLSALFMIARSVKTKLYWWILPALAAIGLFLPMFGVTMPKEQWIPIDFIGAAVFAAAAFTLAKPKDVDLTKGLPSWHEDYQDAELEYPTETSWVQISVIAAIVLFLLWSWTSGGGTDCPNWVQDPRGGYCGD
jgi:hypothetical protein